MEEAIGLVDKSSIVDLDSRDRGVGQFLNQGDDVIAEGVVCVNEEDVEGRHGLVS